MTDENGERQQPAEPPHEELSYSERYAGTAYGQPIAPPIVVKAKPQRQGRSRFGCFGIALILVGLYWLIPGVLGFISTLNLWTSGKLFDQALPAGAERALGTALVISLIVSVVYILIGLKILIRPGRYSLGCTGVLAFVGVIIVGLGVSRIQDPPTGVLIAFGIYVAISVIFTLVAITAAQVVD